MQNLLFDLTTLDTPSRHRGSGRYVRELACGLMRVPRNELGDIRLLGLTHLSINGDFRITEDLASFSGSSSVPVPGARNHLGWAYARRLALFRAARRVGARAVHLGDPNATPLLMGLTSCKTIVTCHDAIPTRFPSHYFGWADGGEWLGAAIERRRFQSADLVVAISEATRRDAIDLLGVEPERLSKVYNGIDVERWAADPGSRCRSVLERLGIGARAFMLYVGGFHWHKNVEGMVAGIAHARATGLDVELVWAGKLTSEQAAFVREVANRAGAASALRLVGYVSDEDLSCLYRAALGHVLVSRSEGFGLTIVEAMASGCPVVTTSAGSLAEVAGDAALEVDPEDAVAIGGAFLRLAEDGALRENLVTRGRLRAASFDLHVQARAMTALYRRFLNT
ncbi:MAG TPA: glycosyltransferase family 1 protein [Polyangiaceae bacterium]